MQFTKQTSDLMDKQPIQQQQQAYIGPGRFIDIDEKLYSEPSFVKIKEQPKQMLFAGIPEPIKNLIEPIKPDKLRLNYNTYLYNQITNTF